MAEETQAPPTEGTVVTETKPEVATVSKKKNDKTGNLIVDIAHEVEAMSKVKALIEADRLAENIQVNYFKLGGLLKLIKENSWFEGFSTFDDFVLERFGFAARKAQYLMDIYYNLVTKLIPWAKVSGLGWTKLRYLAKALTTENVDNWVAKAETLTVADLQKLLKVPESAGVTTHATTDDVVTVKLNLKPDQAEIFNHAVAKAKGELKTHFDTVAVENIMAGYVGGLSSVPITTASIDDFIHAVGLEKLLTRIAELYPQLDITVAEVKPTGEGKEAAAEAAT